MVNIVQYYTMAYLTDITHWIYHIIFLFFHSVTQSRNYPSTLHLDAIIAESDTDWANLLNRYFHSVFSDTSVQSNVENNLEPINSFSSILFTVEEVYQALLSLDPTKAPGIDLISPKILQSCVPILCQPLHHLFTMSLRYAHIPSTWKVH